MLKTAFLTRHCWKSCIFAPKKTTFQGLYEELSSYKIQGNQTCTVFYDLCCGKFNVPRCHIIMKTACKK